MAEETYLRNNIWLFLNTAVFYTASDLGGGDSTHRMIKTMWEKGGAPEFMWDTTEGTVVRWRQLQECLDDRVEGRLWRPVL